MVSRQWTVKKCQVSVRSDGPGGFYAEKQGSGGCGEGDEKYFCQNDKKVLTREETDDIMIMVKVT